MRNNVMREAFALAALKACFVPSSPTVSVIRVAQALERTAPVPRTKEDKRGWRVKLSFPTYRKLVNQGYEVL